MFRKQQEQPSAKITMVTATVSVGYVWNDANVVCTDEFELIEDKSTRNDR